MTTSPFESMTGYATQSQHWQVGELSPSAPSFMATVELQSINARYLEIQWRGDDIFRGFEGAARQIIKHYFSRGKISLSLRGISSPHDDIGNGTKLLFSPLPPTPADPAIQARINELLAWQDALLQHAKDAKPLSVEEWLRYLQPKTAGYINIDNAWVEDKATWEASILPAWQSLLHRACKILQMNRATEATTIVSALQGFSVALSAHWQKIKDISQDHHHQSQTLINLRAQVGKLLSHEKPIDENRLYQELALILIRHDITEELDRLSAHLKALDALLTTPEKSQSADGVSAPSLGKPLDFLTQELNREVNTIASKTTHTQISHATLAMKQLIDQIREQAQNLQ